MKNQNLILFLLLFLGNMMLYGQCNVNAGGNATICGTSYTMQGSSSDGSNEIPVWTIVSKPAGAPDPVFSNINAYTPNVTGMTFPGNYVFRITKPCSSGTEASSQVIITAPGAVNTFTAGPDITNVNATIGTVTLNGVVPDGYTASWSAYNIYNWERSSVKNSQNAQFSSTNLATTTFSLTKKADHDVDPAYVVTLRITSNNNPNCWYEDTAIVRFIPNPRLVPTVSTSRCISEGGDHFISLQSTSPVFSKGYPASPGSSGNFGTTITTNVISQPAGGDIEFSHIFDKNIFFTGVNAVGTYSFTLTIANASGTFTTPTLTYTFNGYQPNNVSFLTPSRPDQMMIYNSSASGGEVHCNWVGQTTPITVLFSLNPSDPVSLTTTVANSGITPPGGTPTLSTVSGSGTSANRSFTVTPRTGGWQVGTYKITVTTGNGTCSRIQSYYIHISDGNRPDVSVPNTAVCYPGSGVVTATIPLPDVYKGVVNTSYFQDFDGRYELTLVSGPSGAATPVFEPFSNRKFTNTSTTISNLNKEGEYVFRIKAVNFNSDIGAFLEKEYACSGASMESTFSVFVSAQVGANAGSNQNVTGTTTILNGNNPGVASGTWTVISKPTGASDPVIVDPSLYNSSVTGLTGGVYVFRWSVATGTCISTSDVTVTVMPQDYCFTGDCNPNTFLHTSDPNTIEYDNIVSTFHSTMMRDASTGALMVWGEDMANNGLSDILSPIEVNNTNYPALTGDILKFTAGSLNITRNQKVVLTTDGLFAWGGQGYLISSNLTSSTTFQKVSIGTYGVNGGTPKADGLPDGVAPEDVKMLFGSYRTLALTTCTGEAWVLAQSNSFYGDNAPDNTTNDQLWHRVHIDATTTLNNVVAIRGNGDHALMALTADGETYTWGQNTFLGNGTAQAVRPFATKMTLPAGVTPKMIGATRGITYYVLDTNGNLYSLGINTYRQLGNFTTTNSNTWVQVQKSATTGDYLTNVVWISPNEHDGLLTVNGGSINVLTADGRLWAWGENHNIMLGGTGNPINPTEMPGSIPSTNPYDIGKLNWTDTVIAVETGGHTSMIVKDNSQKYGYVGHRINGSMGDGTSTDAAENVYNFADTPEIDLCGAPVEEGYCTQPGATGTPDGFTKVGISTLASQTSDWPENIPNGWITMESKTQGFVITRVQHVGGGTNGAPDPADSIADPQDGMLVYDIDDACVKLFNGTIWNCIERSCNEATTN